jgi:hypothetical protein
MTITIELPPEVETALQKKAAADGKNIHTYIFETLQTQALKPSLDEILAPLRKNFADSGMTETELDELIERERQAMWEENNKNRG